MTLITVSGYPGSGTTSLATELAEGLGIELVSTGAVFRQWAADNGCSLEEYGRRACANPQIDRDLDEMILETVGGMTSCVFEGRLAGCFFPNADLRIWLYAPHDVRLARVMARSGETEGAMYSREAAEWRRYREIYGFDIEDKKHYDLVLNTERLSVGQLAEAVIGALPEASDDRRTLRHLRSLRRVRLGRDDRGEADRPVPGLQRDRVSVPAPVQRGREGRGMTAESDEDYMLACYAEGAEAEAKLRAQEQAYEPPEFLRLLQTQVLTCPKCRSLVWIAVDDSDLCFRCVKCGAVSACEEMTIEPCDEEIEVLLEDEVRWLLDGDDDREDPNC